MGVLSHIRSRVGTKFVVAFVATLLVPFVAYVALMQWTSYRAFRAVERQELASAIAGVRLALDGQAQTQLDETVDCAE